MLEIIRRIEIGELMVTGTEKMWLTQDPELEEKLLYSLLDETDPLNEIRKPGGSNYETII